MLSFHEQYLMNDKGKKERVVLSVNVWKKILSLLEDYDDIRAYDRAKARKSSVISFDEAKKRLKNG